jgi:hypothetical protein
MDFVSSNDFGARDFDGKPGREIHDHFFPGANTGLAAIRDRPDVMERHAKFLADKQVRVDIFALREGGNVDGALLGPIRPETPTVAAGKPYLVEVVVRTLGLGHPFSQGTVDSNEIWVELVARTRRRGRPLFALHQRLHARPRRQADRPAEPARHLRPAL